MNALFKRRRARIGGLTIILAGLFLIGALRLTMLVLIDGPRLTSLGKDQHTSTMKLAAVRGPIVDRNEKPLALSAEARSVFGRPAVLLEASTAEDRAPLAAAAGISRAKLEAQLHRGAQFVWIARQLSLDSARAIEDLGLPGVGTVNEYKRFYPEGGLAASVVGMAGLDGQGLSGVERRYHKLISGEPVELRFYHDALGHPILDSPFGLKSAEPGARVELTIDASIQAVAENYLGRQVASSGARRGAAVVLDPFTGEVLALADVGARRSKFRSQLRNSAVQDAFEPGSTMKGILAAIALEDHVIDTRRRIYCENGEWHVGGRVVHDDSRQQWLDLAGIIEVSSNIGAAKIALALGARRFHQGLNAFGFGGKTGIDLPGEASGLLAAPAKWRTIELADHGFGQGVAVTPIQLATAYAAIANGGVVMRPFVVKAAYDATGHEILRRTPQAVRRAVSPDVAHKVNQLLRGVIDAHDGTGHLAQVADFTVAGKTGTAQMVNPATHSYDPNRLVVSFVGFLPADDPRLVILVVLYDVPRGSFGGIVAAPVFSEIASDALRHLDITPSPGSGSYDVASLLPFTSDGDEFAGVAEESTGAPITHTGDNRLAAFAPTTTEEQARAPDFRGLSLRHALALARRYGLQLDVKGAGYVRGQEPRAGALMDRGTVQLALSSEDDVATNLRTVAAGLNPHWIRSGMRGEREDRRSRSLQ